MQFAVTCRREIQASASCNELSHKALMRYLQICGRNCIKKPYTLSIGGTCEMCIYIIFFYYLFIYSANNRIISRVSTFYSLQNFLKSYCNRTPFCPQMAFLLQTVLINVKCTFSAFCPLFINFLIRTFEVD